MRKLIKICCVVLALGLCGCSASPKDSEAVRKNPNTLVYGSGDYTAINPALYEHGEINSLIFSGLTAHDGNNQVIPCLAKDWSFDKTDNVYTFHLRSDVKWQDGEPFTSADVRYTLEAVKDPANGSEIASNYEDVIWIETPDDYTVELGLAAPNVALLDYLTVGMLPAHLLEGKDLATDPFNHMPVGTGPYRLVSWEPGQRIVLEKYEGYFGTPSKIERIVFQIVPDEKVRAMQMKSGELDLAQIAPQDGAALENTQGIKLYDMRTADYRGILYNFQSPLFRDHRELPLALGYAIDRAAIVESVLRGKGEPAYSPLQRGPYFDGELDTEGGYAPEKTKRLLEDAGWRMETKGVYEKNGVPLEFTITCVEGDPVRLDMASIYAQELGKAGVSVKVEVTSDPDWENMDAYLIGWGSPFDPDDHTYKVFSTGQAANYGHYSNKEVDRLLKAARSTEDVAERTKNYQDFQRELKKDPPFTFLAYVDAVYAAKDGLTGIQEDMVLGHHGVGIFWNVTEWTFT